MKNLYRYILPAIMAVLTMASCGKEDSEPEAVRDYPSFSATIEGIVTRVSDNSWEDNDKIGIYGGEASNLSHSHQGNGRFAATDPAKQIVFTDDTPVRFFAYHPYGTPANSGTYKGKFNTYANKNLSQADQKNFDYLWAYADGSKADPDVKFSFTHRMSKITLVFQSDEIDVGDITAYSVSGLYLRGTFDPQTGKCEVTTPSTSSTSVTVKSTDPKIINGKPAPPIIVFPQTLKSNPLGISITAAKANIGTITGSLTFKDGELKPGHNYQFVINVRKTGITVHESTIKGWNDNDQGNNWEAK